MKIQTQKTLIATIQARYALSSVRDRSAERLGLQPAHRLPSEVPVAGGADSNRGEATCKFTGKRRVFDPQSLGS